jgi:hypothetical protein
MGDMTTDCLFLGIFGCLKVYFAVRIRHRKTFRKTFRRPFFVLMVHR